MKQTNHIKMLFIFTLCIFIFSQEPLSSETAASSSQSEVMEALLARIAALENKLNRLQEDRDKIFGPDSILHRAHVPVGTIVMWHNKEGEIPQGWLLCDGKDGLTPDLIGKFIRGDKREKLGTTGGKDSIERRDTIAVGLSVEQLPSHSHPQYVSANPYKGSDAIRMDWTPYEDRGRIYTIHEQGCNTGNVGGNKAHSHPIQGHDNRPEFVSVVFIMKVKHIEIK